MNWKGDDDRESDRGDLLTDFAYPPSGGWGKMVCLGILLPLYLGYGAAQGWISGESVWKWGRAFEVLHGKAVVGHSVMKLGVALFCHFRWFWGLLPQYQVFEVGTVVSLVMFVGGLFYTFLMMLA